MEAVPEELVKALKAEVESLRAELQRKANPPITDLGDQGTGGWPWMYWRRPPEGDMAGWIVIGPGGETPRGHRNTDVYNFYRKLGFEPLDQYGYIPPPTSPNAAHDFAEFIRRGGAKEFPLSQILAFKWHLNPPVRGAVFPQYEAVKEEVQHAVCPQCPFDLYAPPEDRSLGNRLFEHLWSVHEFDPEKAEAFCHRQGFVDVRQQITDELTVARNRRAAEKRLNRRKGRGDADA